MPGITDVPGVEVWGKGRGEYTLPCGCVDGQGEVHRKIILREMTGYEEDMMDDDEIPRVQRITDVLAACIEQIGTITDKEMIRQIIADEMPAGHGITSTDRIAAMVFLRRASVGDIYKFQRRCPRCGHMNKNRTLDLSTIKMTPVPKERVSKRRVEVTLPRTKKKAIVRVMTAKHEDRILQLRPTQKDLRTAAMAARVESIDGSTFPDTQAAMDALKGLPQADRVYIREIYDIMEADVDTAVEVVCDSSVCRAEYEFQLDLGQAFFSNTQGAGVTEKELNWL
jgi:hypothetical protein